MQFSIAGILKWATYYGGNVEDFGISVYSDGANVWATGATSSTNFPVLNPGGGAYFQGALGGTESAFILQFDTAGVRKWATYYTGNTGELGESICSDGTNVWVTGTTGSTNFPILNPGNRAYFQSTLASASGNIFILQFNIAGVRKWATYYGGNTTTFSDEGFSIQSDGKNVWVTGWTASPNFPTFNPGGGAYFQGAATGNSLAAFILQFNTAGVRKWATYYGGNDSNGGDNGNSIYSDGKSVWVTGFTGSMNFPTYNPGGKTYFQGTPSLGGDAFILQFDTGGVRKWATYYGGIGDGDIGYSIQSDGSNVWVCGATTSTAFPTLNPGCGFYQGTLGPSASQDVFILQFNTSGVRKWATYYGVDQENDDSYIWSDGINLFVAGDAVSKDYPTVNPGGGAYYADSVSGYENIFIGKFIIDRLSVQTHKDSICEGNSTTITSSGATSYSWSPPTGLSATNIANPVASPTVTTTYTVIGNSGGCLDTNTVTIKVKQSPVVTACCDTSIITGQSVHLSASGSGSYSWTPSTGLSCDTCPDPIATPNQTTTYTLTISNDSGCSAQRMVTIDVECGTVFVPDVFSPNAAHNNILYVRGSCIASMDFIVFDRWGNKVFESQNINDGWNGTYNGKPMNIATYVWALKATLLDGTSIEKKGDVTLVR